MLPDFPAIKREIASFLNRRSREQIRQDPFLSRIRHKRIFEGRRTTIKRDDDKTEQIYQIKLESGLYVTREELIEQGIQIVLERSVPPVETIMDQQVRLILEEAQKSAEKVGNVIDAKGSKFTFELFLNGLEKIQIEFDEKGTPLMPTLYISPEMLEQVKANLEEWNTNPEYKERFNALIDKKRREWNDREGNRRLVD